MQPDPKSAVYGVMLTQLNPGSSGAVRPNPEKSARTSPTEANLPATGASEGECRWLTSKQSVQQSLIQRPLLVEIDRFPTPIV